MIVHPAPPRGGCAGRCIATARAPRRRSPHWIARPPAMRPGPARSAPLLPASRESPLRRQAWALAWLIITPREEYLSSVLPLYALTRICSWEYIKSVESAFAIIAEPNRRAILSLLVSSQQSVREIKLRLRMPQPNVTKEKRNENQTDQRIRGRPGQGPALLYAGTGLCQEGRFQSGPISLADRGLARRAGRH